MRLGPLMAAIVVTLFFAVFTNLRGSDMDTIILYFIVLTYFTLITEKKKL